MKIEVKESGKKEYYDEFLYVVNNYKRFKKNPHKKAYEFSKCLFLYEIFLIISILLFTLFYIQDKNLIFMFIIGMLSLIFVFVLLFLSTTKKQIKTLLNIHVGKIIDINNNYIGFKDNQNDIKIKWEDIEVIIINKYSICFIPKKLSSSIISISTDYKNEVIRGLDQINKNLLLVDNN